MADVDAQVVRNADAPWNVFSPDDYWRRNYRELQAEDREIIRCMALPVTRADVQEQFTALGAGGLSVELLSTNPLVRDGYQGMIVATGFADGH